MKTLTLAIMIIAAGLLIAGVTACSKTTGNNNIPPQSVDSSNDSLSPDMTAQNPDIGTLDDSPVSDEMPQ